MSRIINGNTIETEILIENTTAQELTALDDGSFIASWMEGTKGIYFQRYNASGVAVGSKTLIDSEGAEQSLIKLANGGWANSYYKVDSSGSPDIFL